MFVLMISVVYHIIHILLAVAFFTIVAKLEQIPDVSVATSMIVALELIAVDFIINCLRTIGFAYTRLPPFPMYLLEAVSKPPQDDHEASELGEAMEEEGVELVAGNEPSEGLHPTDRALD
ncbi:MAG: hypothetical protein K8U03_10595, partial [Planctomycetia bacterium]|nr:hypothetical protein [Planctomycetia bacterium]